MKKNDSPRWKKLRRNDHKNKKFNLTREDLDDYIAEFLKRKEITKLPPAGIRFDDYMLSTDHFTFKGKHG